MMQLKSNYSDAFLREYTELLKHDKQTLAAFILMMFGGQLSQKLKKEIADLGKITKRARIEGQIENLKKSRTLLLSGEIEIRNPEGAMEYIESQCVKLERKLEKLNSL